jgi:putative tryptophan/tyrosine transport system substrate-binding protein
MQRREFITLLGGTAAAWPLVAHAQVSERLYRVAYLALTPGENTTRMKTFAQRLKELGYVEGKNITIDYRSADGRAEQLSALAVELVSNKPDVLVAGFGTLTAQAAKAATRDIPIVFTSVGDPLGAHLVVNLARPDGNVTGLASQSTETAAKRLQILEKLLASQPIIAVLMNPGAPAPVLALKELRAAAEKEGVRLEILEITAVSQVPGKIEAGIRAGATGLLVIEDPLTLAARQQVIDLCAQFRLPAVHGDREFVQAGGLMSYGTDRQQLLRRAAEFVDKLLKGAVPSAMPIEQPTKFELVINMKAAKLIGLDVPSSVIALADEVIE